MHKVGLKTINMLRRA